MKQWIVGQYIKGKNKSMVWEFQGVFDSKRKAKKACRTNMYFIFSVTLNQSLPHESVEAPEAEYPLATKGKAG